MLRLWPLAHLCTAAEVCTSKCCAADDQCYKDGDNKDACCPKGGWGLEKGGWGLEGTTSVRCARGGSMHPKPKLAWSTAHAEPIHTLCAGWFTGGRRPHPPTTISHNLIQLPQCRQLCVWLQLLPSRLRLNWPGLLPRQ